MQIIVAETQTEVLVSLEDESGVFSNVVKAHELSDDISYRDLQQKYDDLLLEKDRLQVSLDDMQILADQLQNEKEESRHKVEHSWSDKYQSFQTVQAHVNFIFWMTSSSSRKCLAIIISDYFVMYQFIYQFIIIWKRITLLELNNKCVMQIANQEMW